MGYMAGLGIEEGPGFRGCILLMGRSGGCYFDHTSLGVDLTMKMLSLRFDLKKE